MKYNVQLEQIDLKEAVNLLLDDMSVFYTYQIGKPIYKLTDTSLAISIKRNAIYLTPCSFVEEVNS